MSKSHRTFVEHVDPVKCTQVLQLPKHEIKQTFFVNNNGMDWNQYWTRFSQYLRTAISKKGVMTRTYKYGKGSTNGRWYVEQCGVQSLQSKLRNFICGELYYDIDIINCWPRLLLYLCEAHDIQFHMLKLYVEDRAKVLADNGLTKLDINVTMNTDNNKKRHGNDFYNCFIYELESVKDRLLPKLDASLVSPVSNSKNPKSSQLSKHLQVIEEQIIEIAVEYFDVFAEIPMFDGIMVNTAFCKPTDIHDHVKNLNGLLDDRYNGLAEFAIKSTESDIVLADLEDTTVVDEYEVVKVKFEKDHFQTMNPYICWKQYLDADGMHQHTQLNLNEFKTACKEYPIIEYRPSGTLMTPAPSIYDRWMEDKSRRKYESINFIPFGKENTCPPHIFNTFKGFRINNEKPAKPFEEVSINNFRILIWNLCNEELEMSDYLMKYVAHMFQFPNRLTEKIIVLRSWTGCGKDTFHRILSDLMGFEHVGMTGDPEAVFGQFNEIMDSKVAVFLNEMEGKNGIMYQEKMKHQASSKKTRVNAKYNKPLWQNNYARLFINSNQDGCVNPQVHDRRFVIINSGFGLVQNTNDKKKAKKLEKYWDTLYNNLNSYDWRKSLYDMLMNIDLTGWSPKQVPKNVHHDLLRRRNINPLHEYLKDVIDRGDFSSYEKQIIQGKEMHLIGWKPWFTDYKNWVERHTEIDYAIKADAVKVKLSTMNNGWKPDKVYRLTIGEESFVKRLTAFDFTAMKGFLDDYVFKENLDEKIVDLSESNATPPGMSSSVEEF